MKLNLRMLCCRYQVKRPLGPAASQPAVLLHRLVPSPEKEPDEEFCWSWKLAIILRDIGFDQLVGFCVEKLKVLDCNTVSVPSDNIETGV